MGRATVDLPDPLDTPPTSLAGTDDLLAQMAGEEIDRLLAESGVEPDASAPLPGMPTSPPAPTTPPKSTETSTESRAPAVRAPVTVEPAVPETDEETAADAPPLSPAQLESDAELDALLDEMSRAEREGLRGSTPPPAAEVTPAVPIDAPPAGAAPVAENLPGPSTAAAIAGVSSAVAAAVPTPAPASDASESLMSAAERDALSLSDLGAATDAAAPDSADGGRPSLMVRVLEFLNAPLASASDGARDALGKAAIVTLVNALAVLIYVLFFRG